MSKYDAILRYEMRFYKVDVIVVERDERFFNSRYKSIYILYTYQG